MLKCEILPFFCENFRTFAFSFFSGFFQFQFFLPHLSLKLKIIPVLSCLTVKSELVILHSAFSRHWPLIQRVMKHFSVLSAEENDFLKDLLFI